ncbi:MAG TPA: DUF2079 domain-containing protein [bacterium]|nr:DUF2079 domain-containing protein [bacterium]
MIKKISIKIQRSYFLLIIAAIFFVVYSALSLVRHHNFQSNAFDLGIFNQTIYNYAHLTLGPNTLRHVDTLLGDHFEPIMFLFSPLYYLFGSYTLLIIQIFAIILGGFGVYKIVKEHTRDRHFSVISAILFYVSFGVYQALAFDYHNNVVGAMAIPWLLYFILKNNYFKYYLLLVLFLLCKETLGLIGIMLGISIIIFDRHHWRHGVLTLLISFLFFILTTQILIPLFNSNGNQYDHWQSFNNLGTGPLDAIRNALIHPLSFAGKFFDSGLKIGMWKILFVCGGLFAFFYPRYSILLVPIIAQKFLAQNQSYWGYYFHYNIELVIIMTVAASFFIFQYVKNNRLKYFLIISLCIINIGYSFRLKFFDSTGLSKIFDYHYYACAQCSDIDQAMSMIPVGSDVVAQNHLIPHLSNRSNISNLSTFTHSEDNTNPDESYQCPGLAKHQYLILNIADDSVWPMKDTEQLEQIIVRGYNNNPNIKKLYDHNDVILYQVS